MGDLPDIPGGSDQPCVPLLCGGFVATCVFVIAGRYQVCATRGEVFVDGDTKALVQGEGFFGFR